MRTYTLALLLLWLSLTGGYAGWKSPLLWVNVVGWGILLAWMIGQAAKRPLGRVETAMMLFITALLVSTIITGARGAAIGRIAVWFAYLGFYYLGSRWTDEEIHRAAALALLPYPLLVFLPWENPNVIAFNFVGLTLLAMPILNWKIYIPLFVWLAWPLNSVGGILAALVSLIRLSRYSALAFLLGAWFNSVGCAYRLQFWAEAWRDFLSSPWVGVGLGNYHLFGWWHAHNLIATTAAETGLIGLAGLALLIGSIARRWLTLPAWAAAVILAYGAWSLVDEPLHFWGAAFIFFLALSRRKESNDGVEVSKTQLEV
jgi:hypothetical protein